MVIQLVLPRAIWKAFTLCQPFLGISQGEHNRFFKIIFNFYQALQTSTWPAQGTQNLDQYMQYLQTKRDLRTLLLWK